jgi:hypothetical protein
MASLDVEFFITTEEDGTGQDRTKVCFCRTRNPSKYKRDRIPNAEDSGEMSGLSRSSDELSNYYQHCNFRESAHTKKNSTTTTIFGTGNG